MGVFELATMENLNGANFHRCKHIILLELTLQILIYVLEKFYLVLLEKPPAEEPIKELKNYRVDDMMTIIIILTYKEDGIIRFFEDYKITNEVFKAIKARYNANTTAHIQV